MQEIDKFSGQKKRTINKSLFFVTGNSYKKVKDPFAELKIDI